MLVLLSFALVVLATVLLVLGLLTSGGLTLVYVSIGLSVVSAVLLIVAVRMARPAVPPATPPAPIDPDRRPEPAAVATASGTASSAPTAPASTTEQPADTAEEPADTAEKPSGKAEATAAAPFPIADYEDLHESEVLGLLPSLSRNDLDAVEARERSTKARPEILTAIAERRPAAPQAAKATAPAADVDWEVDDEAPARSEGPEERNPPR